MNEIRDRSLPDLNNLSTFLGSASVVAVRRRSAAQNYLRTARSKPSVALFSLLNVVDSDAAETAKNLTFCQHYPHLQGARDV